MKKKFLKKVFDPLKNQIFLKFSINFEKIIVIFSRYTHLSQLD